MIEMRTRRRLAGRRRALTKPEHWRFEEWLIRVYARFLIAASPITAESFARKHYARFSKHGDPLSGRTPPGDPIRWIHAVAIRHVGDDCLTWPCGKGDQGYGKLTTEGGKRTGSHRYLCQLVHGEPPTSYHEAAHSCGNGHLGCVSPRHLQWKTREENEADKRIHGTHMRGERHGNAKLTEQQVIDIVGLKGDQSQLKIAKRFGVSAGTIADIHCGKKWAWLTGLPK